MSTLPLDVCVPVGFADDPIASHSSQFGLCRPADTAAGYDNPSPAGVRPWNLRHAEGISLGKRAASLGGWHYDFHQQLAVGPDGQRVIDMVAGDPTADSVSNQDGDEGTSED